MRRTYISEMLLFSLVVIGSAAAYSVAVTATAYGSAPSVCAFDCAAKTDWLGCCSVNPKWIVKRKVEGTVRRDSRDKTSMGRHCMRGDYAFRRGGRACMKWHRTLTVPTRRMGSFRHEKKRAVKIAYLEKSCDVIVECISSSSQRHVTRSVAENGNSFFVTVPL